MYKYLNLQNEKNKEIEQYNILAYYFKTKFITKQNIIPKKPVVTIMGHVDHGKTTLLDYLRDSDVADKEHGGITQKIGGFTLNSKFGKISFIDTPGHALFKNMRETGVNVTDYVVLIISATEGPKPQTLEVLEMIKKSKLPYLIAINKIDLKESDVEKVEEELIELGIELEPYGGDIPVIHISAKTGLNCNLLLELLIEECKNLKISADYDNLPEMQVIESFAQDGKKLKTTAVVVKSGILKKGKSVIFDGNFSKIKNIYDYHHNNLEKAEPGDIVEIAGLDILPTSKDILVGVEKESSCKIHQEIFKNIDYFFSGAHQKRMENTNFKIKYKTRREKRTLFSRGFIMEQKMKEAAKDMLEELETEMSENKKLTVEQKKKNEDKLLALNEQLNSLKDIKNYINPILIKVPDIGTKDAINSYINNMEKKNFTILTINCNNFSEDEILQAQETGATIYLFDFKIDHNSNKILNSSKKCKIKKFNIIYQFFEDLDNISLKEGEKKTQEFAMNSLGFGEIKQIFLKTNLKNKKMKICGCVVNQGIFRSKGKYRLKRNGQILVEDLKISSLKRFKNEVEEIKEGEETGVSFMGYKDFQEGDEVECYF